MSAIEVAQEHNLCAVVDELSIDVLGNVDERIARTKAHRVDPLPVTQRLPQPLLVQSCNR